jgi:hypothetical protein
MTSQFDKLEFTKQSWGVRFSLPENFGLTHNELARAVIESGLDAFFSALGYELKMKTKGEQ